MIVFFSYCIWKPFYNIDFNGVTFGYSSYTENSSITLGAIYQSGTGKLYYFNSGPGNSVWDTQLDVKKDYLVLLVSATSKY